MVVGKRGTGKTTLLRNLLLANGNQWDLVVGITLTPESYDVLVEMFPESCIHRDYNAAVITNLIETLDALNALNIHPRVLLVLDDCMHDSRILKSDPMRQLHKLARYLRIDVYNVVQYAMDVPSAIRSRIDYVFALCEPQRTHRQNLYRDFFNIFPSYDEFSAAFDACTENYGCIVVDRTAKANAIEGSVFWYRALPSPTLILLGSPAQWLLHHMFYRAPCSVPVEPALDALLGAIKRAVCNSACRVRLVDN